VLLQFHYWEPYLYFNDSINYNRHLIRILQPVLNFLSNPKRSHAFSEGVIPQRVCYDLNCPISVKCNLNHVYISSWALSPCKLIFKGKFYLRFVLLGIKAAIKLSMKLNVARRVWDRMGCDFVTES